MRREVCSKRPCGGPAGGRAKREAGPSRRFAKRRGAQGPSVEPRSTPPRFVNAGAGRATAHRPPNAAPPASPPAVPSHRSWLTTRSCGRPQGRQSRAAGAAKGAGGGAGRRGGRCRQQARLRHACAHVRRTAGQARRRASLPAKPCTLLQISINQIKGHARNCKLLVIRSFVRRQADMAGPHLQIHAEDGVVDVDPGARRQHLQKTRAPATWE